MKFRSTSAQAVGENSPVANDHNERKVMSVRNMLLLILVAIFATSLFSVASANASYTRVLPTGLSSNAKVAKHRVQALIANDAGIQERLAQDNGVSEDDIANGKVVKMQRTHVTIGKDVDNSARNSVTGDIVPSSYKSGQTVAAWSVTIHVSASRTVVVKWKMDCSNPFLRKSSSPPPLRIARFSKSFVMKFSKKKATVKQVTCPSGQQITITVVSSVKGRVRVRSLTKGVKVIKQKLSAQVTLDVKNLISVSCGITPPPPTVTCESLGLVTGANGNCVVQSNSAEQNCKDNGGTWDSVKQQCTIIQINANCSNVTVTNGTGNVVMSSQQGNCNTIVTPPPTCTSNCTPPPPPPPTCPSGSVWNGEKCVKDGNTTPPPSGTTPGGQNPTDSNPSSYACYDTTTGQPVSPVYVNGVPLCPSGSYGQP